MGRVLIIAGSDSGGGAGIQADIKTVTALGGYAATALTAVTVQDTTAVYDVFPIPPEIIVRQIEVVLDDIGADAIKIGMLYDEAVVEAVAEALDEYAGDIPIVLDPVLVATSGDALASDAAARALVKHLIPKAALVTPNLSEAAVLTAIEIHGADDLMRAAEELLKQGAAAVLIKDGHGEGESVRDILVTENDSHQFENPRIDTDNTHGTGCTLASAIAAGLADGIDVIAAAERGIDYVWKAIDGAPGYGRGHGPLDHAHTFTKAENGR